MTDDPKYSRPPLAEALRDRVTSSVLLRQDEMIADLQLTIASRDREFIRLQAVIDELREQVAERDREIAGIEKRLRNLSE
jgi:uncharacterized coiled-coil protein SlyX